MNTKPIDMFANIGKIELIPLGSAINATLFVGNARGLELADLYAESNPANEVRKEWVSPATAKLYAEWQALEDHDQRMEWISNFSKVHAETAMQALRDSDQSTRIMTPRDALNRLKDNWFLIQERQLYDQLSKCTTKGQRSEVFGKLESLNCEQRNKAIVIDMDNPPERDVFTLERNGVGIMPSKAISTLQAKAKSGKTKCCSILVACCITQQNELFGFNRPGFRPPLHVLYIDTEQSPYSTYKLKEEVLRLSGYSATNNDLLEVVNVCSLSKEERFNEFKTRVSSMKYEFVVLDGIRDLANDINNNVEASRLIENISNICKVYKVALLTVLHENPSLENEKMRGHLGTELENKIHDSFEVSKDKEADVFNIFHCKGRTKPINTWAFHFVPDPEKPSFDMLEECEPTDNRGTRSKKPGQEATPKETSEDKNWNQVVNAFGDQFELALTFDELEKGFYKNTNITSKPTVVQRIDYFLKKEWLKMDEGGSLKNPATRIHITPGKLAEIRSRLNNNFGTPF